MGDAGPPKPRDQAREQLEQQRKEQQLQRTLGAREGRSQEPTERGRREKQSQDTSGVKRSQDKSTGQQQFGKVGLDRHEQRERDEQSKENQRLKQTLDARNAGKEGVQDKTKPTDTKPNRYLPDDGIPDFYDLLTKPPKIDNIFKSVTVGDLKIPKRTAPQKAVDLGTHTPTAPPEDVFGQKKEASSKPDFEFPPEIIRHSDRVLSAKEKAERRRVHHPQDGVGRPFDKDVPADGEMDRWINGLSKEKRVALNDPNAEVTITTTNSLVGSAKYNLNLSERYAKNVAMRLRKEHGVSAKIKLEAMGKEPAEWRGAPPGKDDHTDRVAIISILPHKDKGTQSKDMMKALDEARRKGDEIGKRGGPPTPPRKYDYRDGLWDSARDVAINMLSPAASAVTTPSAYLLKIIEKKGEIDEKNIQAAEARGFRDGVNILWRDQKYPNNPHIQEGKLYTTSELHKRVRELYGKAIDYEMKFLKYTTGVDKALKGSIDTLVKAVNPQLKNTQTSADRQVVLKEFVESAQKRMKELYKKKTKDKR